MKQRQFTATVYLFQDKKILLHPHRKLGKWLPPGGHLEANETPPEAARREVEEETGLAIEFIGQENIWIEGWNANSIERPYLCLLEEIPAFGEQPAHQHIDFIFLARPKVRVESDAPLNEFQWLSLEELNSLDLFPDTRRVVEQVLLLSDLSKEKIND